MNNKSSNFQLPVPSDPDASVNPAANLIRTKLAALYNAEPDALSETIESVQEPAQTRSKHQNFMLELASSGKPYAQIQLEWHNYYISLPDDEKHEVWEEFYATQADKPYFKPQVFAASMPQKLDTPTHEGVFVSNFEPDESSQNPANLPKQKRAKISRSKAQKPSVADIKQQITGRVTNRTKLSRKQHIKSVGFGLSMGFVSIAFLLLGFFNERIIAPFITPSRTVSSTPLILNDTTSSVGKESKIIIPKINVEVPVVYDVKTLEEEAIQTGLESGVVHYPTTSNPGEKGNGAIFGHSSNNLLNRGKYKFAFVLLSRLENGDTFYIEKEGVRYVYKIFAQEIVSPEDIGVLDPVPGKSSTMALITCDPPGTTINRLVVWGEQISPEPGKNIASTAIRTDAIPDQLAGNPESLWARIWGTVF
ncbi:MAG: sortase [bacterium]|nr:sortase [bacterium]